MKQSITKEQWNELSDEQQRKYVNFIHKTIENNNCQLASGIWEFDDLIYFFTIGQLIEFLGNDLVEIEKCNWWQVRVNWRIEGDIPTMDTSGEPELIDALWAACKHKLKS